jgi:hypothetical protein
MKCCTRCSADPLAPRWISRNSIAKLFSGSAEAYTRSGPSGLREAQAAGLDIGVIAVLHQGSLDAGPDAFYRYYTEELGLKSFQVNTPFPGGPAKRGRGRIRSR